MFTAAELVEVLQLRHRRRFPLHPDRPFGAFPPTWRAWFLSIAERPGAVVGAPAQELVAIFAARPLRTPPRALPALSRKAAYARLARQQWEPAPRDQRGARRIAVVFSALLHLVFMVALLWLGLVPIGDAPPDEAQAGDAMLVEYIGLGTPAETGGAPAPGEVEAPASSSSAAAAAPATAARPADEAPPAATAEAAASPPPPAASTPEEAPTQPVEAAAPQPLAVTETRQTDIDFTLPAPVPRDPTVPQLQLRVPEIAAPTMTIETFEAKTPVTSIDRPMPRLAAPNVPALRTEVTEVETSRLPTTVTARELPPTTARNPRLTVPQLRTEVADVPLRPLPTPAPAAGTGTAPATAGARTPSTGTSGTAPSGARTPATGPAPGTAGTSGRATSASNAPQAGGQPRATGTGNPATTASSGVGPSPSPRPGAAPTTVRGDDWGASNRNVPGNSTTAGRAPGLFNDDGSIRMPGDGGRVGGGLPPGTVIEDFEKIDRMGTWLKRPPLDYTPTRFDRFWIPHENLLEEWVRRGIKNVAIPLPGTAKRIVCTVSLLQAGGGCSIDDPNLRDQEAIARPPPDVPFKPELQEDKASLGTPPGSAPPPAPPSTP